jgi:glycosyltransferase involved in cell wall biosynthesis
LVALPIAWLAGVPIRIGTHHGHIDGTAAFFARLHGWLTNSRFCSAMVAVSRQVYSFAIDKEKASPAKLTVIENGIEPSVERKISAQERASLRSDLSVSDSQVLFITVGRLTRQKGHADLLDAIAQLKTKQTVFVFAGDGPLRAELEENAQRLQISERVRFLGVRDDVAQLLTAADVFVQPSLWEGLSLALLEALFAGLPVLSTKVEGTVDIVKDGDSAMLVPVGDVDALAKAIDRLAVDASLRSHLAKNGKQRVETRYSVDRMCADYLQLINKLKPA